jgi:hypothetical protein
MGQGLHREGSSSSGSSSSIGGGATDSRVPGTGWVSGAQRADSAPDCTFGPALQWLSHACLDAPCHVTHTLTLSHTHEHPLPTRRPRYHTHTHTHTQSHPGYTWTQISHTHLLAALRPDGTQICDVRMIRSGSDLFSLSRSRGQSCKGALRVVGCFRAGRWLQGQYI